MNQDEVFDNLSRLYDKVANGAGTEIDVVGPFCWRQEEDYTVDQYAFMCNGQEYVIKRRLLPLEWGDFYDEWAFVVKAFTLFIKDPGQVLASAIRLAPGEPSDLEYPTEYQMRGRFAANTFTGVWDIKKPKKKRDHDDKALDDLLMLMKLTVE